MLTLLLTFSAIMSDLHQRRTTATAAAAASSSSSTASPSIFASIYNFIYGILFRHDAKYFWILFVSFLIAELFLGIMIIKKIACKPQCTHLYKQHYCPVAFALQYLVNR